MCSAMTSGKLLRRGGEDLPAVDVDAVIFCASSGMVVARREDNTAMDPLLTASNAVVRAITLITARNVIADRRDLSAMAIFRAHRRSPPRHWCASDHAIIVAHPERANIADALLQLSSASPAALSPRHKRARRCVVR